MLGGDEPGGDPTEGPASLDLGCQGYMVTPPGLENPPAALEMQDSVEP